MIRLLFIIIFAFCLSACSTLSYSYTAQKNQMNFKTLNDTAFVLKLSNPTLAIQNDSCSLYSYTLSDVSQGYGKIFVEDITLHSNCQFNQEALGAFMYEFKEQLKLQSLSKVEELAFKNYEFLTYKVNDMAYVNIIFIYAPFSSTFIVDYEGKLHHELLLQFNPLYKNNYLLEKRFDANYHYSLVRMNIFKGYFSRMSEDFSR